MNKYLLFIFFLVLGNMAKAQCLTSSLVINTGYNPITGTAIAAGANGGTPVVDPYWEVVAVSPATTAAIAATPGVTGVTPGNNADVVTIVGGAWVANPAGDPGNWIACMNSDTYNDPATGLPETMTLGRPFKMCTADNITLDLYVASDNFISSANIDGTIPLTLTGTGYNAYTNFTQTVALSAGTHTINIVVNNQNLTTAGSNPTGLNVYGTVSSSTGLNSIISESYASCSTYNCSSTCNTISLPDSLHLCQGGSDTLRATVGGTDSILSIAWTPVTGLSSSTVLRPLLTVGTTSGWYDITIQSLIPYDLVYNGDFSLGNVGFTSSYTYVSGPNSIQPASTYAITTNPVNVHTGAISFGSYPTGTGNMMAINGASTPISVWCETIAVTPNTNYDFSAWAATWSTVSTGTMAPILQFMINGTLIGTAFTLVPPTGAWENFSATWNSGANTTATICIYDACTAANGNDFALDDISFQQICVTEDSIYVDVHPFDTTYGHVNDSACTLGPAITLTAPSGYSSYLWNTGTAGTTISAGAGAVDWVYAGSTCAVFIDTFHVLPKHPDTTYSHVNDSACINIPSVTLNAPAGYSSYLWSNSSTTSSISVSATGDYWVIATGTSCTVFIDTFHVFFKPLPPAPMVRDTFYCVGYGGAVPLTAEVDSVPGTLNWYFHGSPVSTPTPPTNAVTYPTGTVWYVTQTVDGCESDSSNALTVYIVPPPKISIATSSPWVCQFDTISLTYTGPALINGGFQWSLPPGASFVDGTSLIDSSIYVQFDSASNNSTVYLTASNLLGECPNSDSANIDVILLPTATAISKSDVCLNDTVTLALSSKSADAINFSWYIDSSPFFSSTAVTVIAANANSGGPYSISWTDTGMHIIYVQPFAEHGCTNKPGADTVNVHALPDASFMITTSTGSLCLEDSVLFTANDSNYQDNYSWAPVHFFDNDNIDKPAVWGKVESAQSIVTLTVTDPFGCVAAASKEIDPGSCCSIVFPNSFSPNGDGHNDVFRPIPGSANYIYHIFRIENRWGQVVFESADNRASWDGTFNGVPQDIGVFYYYLKYDCGGKTLEQKGDVTLIK